MPIERIDRTDRLEPWRVQATTEGRKGQGQGQEQELGKDAYAALHDKTDWQILFNKSNQWKTNIQILKEEIESILFRKVNLKTDPSLLRIDILLKGGEKISPAFLAISRAVGLKLKNLNPGDVVPEQYVMKGNVLRVTIPANPKLFEEEEKKIESAKKSEPPKSKVESWDDQTVKKPIRRWRLEIVLTVAFLAAALLLLMGGLFFLF